MLNRLLPLIVLRTVVDRHLMQHTYMLRRVTPVEPIHPFDTAKYVISGGISNCESIAQHQESSTQLAWGNCTQPLNALITPTGIQKHLDDLFVALPLCSFVRLAIVRDLSGHVSFCACFQ